MKGTGMFSRAAIVASSICLIQLVAAPIAFGQGRIPIEKVMRDIQIRKMYLGQHTPWPGCCGSGLSGPLFPPDGYYGEDLDPECAAGFVVTAAQRLADLIPWFLREEDVQALGGGTACPQHYSLSEFPELTNGYVGVPPVVLVQTHAQLLAVIQGIIPKLKYRPGAAGISDTQSRGGLAAEVGGPFFDCEAKYAELLENLHEIWAVDWQGTGFLPMAADAEGFCRISVNPEIWEFDGLMAQRIRGKLTAPYPIDPGQAFPDWPGSASVYFRVQPYPGGVAHNPPVAADDKFHHFASMSISAPYGGSGWIGDGGMPALEYQCPQQMPCCEPTPPGTIPPMCGRGWSMVGSCTVVTPQFNATPDAVPPCTPVPGPIQPQQSPNPGEQGEEEDCGTEGGAQPEDQDPVNLARGRKVERVTDLVVELPGSDFRITREHSSQPDLYSGGFGYGLVGANWSLSVFQRLTVDGPTLKLSGPPLHAVITFYETSPGSGIWKSKGASTREITQGSLTIGPDTFAVWRLTEPGVSYTDFYRAQSGLHASLEGQILQERDLNGRRRTYRWKLLDAIGGGQTTRLMSIKCEGPESAGSLLEATAVFSWYLGPVSQPPAYEVIRGRLSAIFLFRYDSTNQPWLTDQVDYLYYVEGATPPYPVASVHDDGEFSPDLGTDGDLIQVRHHKIVDRGRAALPYRTRITQYRYHNDQTHSGPEPYNVRGEKHQLKSVLQPEQVEFAAQQIAAFLQPAIAAYEALNRGASQLLITHDDQDLIPAPTGPLGRTAAEYAAKIVSYELNGENRVVTQYLQSACGCSGGTQGIKRTYDYHPPTPGTWLTTRTTEYLQLDPVPPNPPQYSTTPYRIISYDMERLGTASPQIPYLRNRAIEEPSGSPARKWVTHYEYDTSQRLIGVFTPAVTNTYTRSQGTTQWQYAPKSNSGLAHVYAYNADNRRTEERVGQGSNSLSTSTLVSRTTYPTSPGTNERKWLPTSTERFAVAGSSAPADVETTTFEYGFHAGSDALAWVRTRVEAELETENGPPGPDLKYDTYELYDSQGLHRWTCAADNSLVFRDYDMRNGSVVAVARNADPAAPAGNAANALSGANFGGISTTGWGTLSNGGELTTTYKVDLAGRVIERTTPGGVSSYVIRELDHEPILRPHLYYYVEVSLPAYVQGQLQYDGPATVSWLNASGTPIRASNYKPSASAPYIPSLFKYTLLTELARTATIHHLSGLVHKQRRWHNISANGFYETVFTYDKVGRVLETTDAVGTITRNDAYDVLDRVLAVKVGTSGEPLQLVAEYFYDSLGTATQEMGNGNLTLIRQYTGEDGTLAESQRDTKRWFDPRDRLEKIERPQAPHEFIVYDNLDREAERAIFETVPSGIGGANDSSRGLYVKSLYSQRGTTYRQRVAINSTNLNLGYLETNSWFDSVGRTIAEWSPNSPGVKRVYDAHGRPVAVYTTDRADDAAPGTLGNYADAASVTSDRVLEQVSYLYNADDRLTRVSTLRRNHDASPTTDVGPLTSANAVATYVGYTYDPVDRQSATLNYGTNIPGDNRFVSGGSAPAVPGVPPSSTDELLVSLVAYDDRGLAAFLMDAKGHSTRYLFDDLSRRIAVIENQEDVLQVEWQTPSGEPEPRWVVASGLEAAEPDTDRVTSFIYDGADNIVRQVAHLPGATPPATDKVQVTKYVYGTTVGSGFETDSLIASNGLLREAHFPDETSGLPGSANAYKVKYAYNRQGELRSVVDQNQTRHVYHRDVSGRVTADKITAWGSQNIDQRIKRIGVTYDNLGRLSTGISYTNENGTGPANGIEFKYAPLWQVARVYQDHNSAATYDPGTGVPSGDTKVVQYTYVSTAPAGPGNASNYSRLTSMAYPDGTALNYAYGTGGHPDDLTHRVVSLSSPFLWGNNIVEYQRVGLDMFAEVDYAASNVQLDRTFSQDGKRRTNGHSTQATGLYPGWDRFGRVAIQAWMDGTLADHPTSTLPTRPPIVDETYTYDRASNRLTRTDARPGAKLANRDWRFEYDGLDRLKTADRGVQGTPWTQGIGGQLWGLDMLGNWLEVREDLDALGGYVHPSETETRNHNQANEILNRDPAPTGTGPVLPFAYDDGGNLRSAMRPSGSSTDLYTHDAWNRLVKFSVQGAQTLDYAEYEYNALHWRSVRRILPQGVPGQLRLQYYSAEWQLIHEEIDDAYPAQPGVNKVSQEVWGLRYIDDPVLRRSYDPAGGGDVPETLHYHLTDVQFSTVAMVGVGSNPILYERVRYRPYGEATHRFPGDFNDDSFCNSVDQGMLTGALGSTIGQPVYDVAFDLNRNGLIDNTDYTQFLWWLNRVPLAPGQISDPGASAAGPGPDNPFGYAGYVFNSESSRYIVRFRSYDPTSGRWLERDPVGYVDGLNIYLYSAADPIALADHMGLTSDDNYHDTPHKNGREMRRHFYKGCCYLGYRDYDPNDAADVAIIAKITADTALLNTVGCTAGQVREITEVGVSIAAVGLIVIPDPSDQVLIGIFGSKLVKKAAGKGWQLVKKGGQWFWKKGDKLDEIKDAGQLAKLKDIEGHHGLPQKFRSWFKEHGIEDIDDPKYRVPLDRSKHRLKPDGVHCGDACESWNGEWQRWIRGPGRDATPEMIEEFLRKLKKKFGI